MKEVPPPSGAPTGNAPHILVVDDDPGQRSLLHSFLSSQGFRITLANSGEEALRVLEAHPVSMMISDVRMPGISGLETLRRARQKHTRLPILLVTAYAEIREAVGAMRDGALNYLSKPIDLDELLVSVRQATGLSPTMPVKVSEEKPLPPEVVVESPLMQALFRDVALIAPSDTRVLITGESGVGKEVLADVIHLWSHRQPGPLVKVNCAAIPETLLESELFGHEKGAFTGASSQRIGRFEQAQGGTIFLDEVSEMSPQLQAKLLRVTQDGRFQRVGSNKVIETDARVLAATNKDLEREVAEGRFREDLFYRLNVVELSIPPLRERREDIMPMANRFVAGFTKGRARCSPALAGCLEQYSWPGNVRELRNALERACLLSRSELIAPGHLPARVREGAASAPASPTSKGAARNPESGGETERLAKVEQEAVLVALRRHRFNRTETAKALGVSRRALIYKLQHLRSLGFEVDAPP